MSKLINMVGNKYGRLFVIERLKNNKQNSAVWKCKCECGKTYHATGGHLRDGSAKSCGCLKLDVLKERNYKHGKYNTPEYAAWQGMKNRCYGDSNTYKYWREKGVTVCPEWLKSFVNFYNDMGDRPSDKYSLDRIDNDGNYTPENCRWANLSIQGLNQSIRSNNTSGVKGVSFCNPKNKWVASITINKKRIALGHFKSFFEACCARKTTENKLLDKYYERNNSV